MRLLRYLNKTHNRAFLIIAIYIPIIVLSLNILLLKNVIIGILFTAMFLAIGAESLYDALNKKFFREPISLRITGLIVFTFFLVAPLSPLMITESIRPIHVVIILLSSGFPLFVVRTKFRASFKDQEIVSQHAPASIIAKWAALAFLSLLISDIVWLMHENVTGYGLISDVVPPAHFYIIFAETGILVFLIFSSLNTRVKILFVLLHSLALHLTWSFLAPTPVGIDPWSLVGDVNASIFGSDRFNSGSQLNQLANITSFRIPDWYLLRIGVSIPYTIALMFQQLTQVNIIQLSPWLGPIIYAVFGRGILFQIGKMVSMNEHYPFFLMMAGSFYPLFMIFGNETLKLTLATPFFLLAIFLWIKYLISKEKWYLYFAIILTSLHIFSYSLFFITLIQISVLVLLLTKFKEDTAKSRHIFLPIVAATTLVLAMLGPAIDLLYKTNIAFPDLSSTVPHFMSLLANSEGPVKDYRELFAIDTDFPFASDSWWTFVNIFVWSLTLLGIIKNTFASKPIYHLLFCFFIVTHAAFYVSEFALSGQRPLGAHMGQIAEIARLPFFAAGLSFAITFFTKMQSRTHPQWISHKSSIAALLTIIVVASVSVTAASAAEIRTYWLGETDVEASKYIVDKANSDNVQYWKSSIDGNGVSFVEQDDAQRTDTPTIKATFHSKEGSVNTLTYSPPALDLSRRNQIQLWVKVDKEPQNDVLPIYISLTDKTNNSLTYTFEYEFGKWTSITLSYSELARKPSDVDLRNLDHLSLSFSSTDSTPTVIWLDIENASGGFILLTQDLSTWPAYGLTNGKMLMGGFNDEPSLGTSPVTRTSTLYWDLRTAPSLEKLESVSKETGACTIFLEIGSYSLPDDGLLQNIMDGPKEFISYDSRGMYKTSVYQKQMC